jgi:hypothetical protein
MTEDQEFELAVKIVEKLPKDDASALRVLNLVRKSAGLQGDITSLPATRFRDLAFAKEIIQLNRERFG